jgi:hypothetical protein
MSCVYDCRNCVRLLSGKELYLRKNGQPEPYTSKTPPLRTPLPQRDRATHAQAIRSTLDAALPMAEARRREREPVWRNAHGVSIWILRSIQARRWRPTCLRIEERTLS